MDLALSYLVNAEHRRGHDLLFVRLVVHDRRAEDGRDALDRGRPLRRLLGRRGQVVHVGNLVEAVQQPHGGPLGDWGRHPALEGLVGLVGLVDLLVVGAGRAEAGVVPGGVERVAVAAGRVGVLVEGRVLVRAAVVVDLEDVGPREGVRVGRHPEVCEIDAQQLKWFGESSRTTLHDESGKQTESLYLCLSVPSPFFGI